MKYAKAADSLPPPPRFSGDPVKWSESFELWGKQVRDALWQMEQNIAQILNGGVEFPGNSPVRNQSQANIRGKVQQFFFWHADPAVMPAVQVFHGLERPAQGFIVMTNTPGSNVDTVLDQIVSSTFPDGYVVGYPNSQTTADPYIVKGDSGGAVGGWTGNGVAAGDQIRMGVTWVPAGTIGVAAADLGKIVGVGTTWKTDLQVGWWIRFTAAGTMEWHQITEILSDTAVRVQCDYLGAIAAGAAYEVLAWDPNWLDVVGVRTTGTEDELDLDPLGPGCLLPAATLGCEYVIRRPSDSSTAWIRFISMEPIGVNILFF